MHKNLHNRILNLPRGTPVDNRVNTFWMLVFSPFLVLLGALAIGGAVAGIYALGYVLFHAIFH